MIKKFFQQSKDVSYLTHKMFYFVVIWLWKWNPCSCTTVNVLFLDNTSWDLTLVSSASQQFCKTIYCTWAWMGSSQTYSLELWICLYLSAGAGPHDAAAWIFSAYWIIHIHIYKPKVVGKLFKMTNLCYHYEIC